MHFTATPVLSHVNLVGLLKISTSKILRYVFVKTIRSLRAGKLGWCCELSVHYTVQGAAKRTIQRTVLYCAVHSTAYCTMFRIAYRTVYLPALCPVYCPVYHTAHSTAFCCVLYRVLYCVPFCVLCTIRTLNPRRIRTHFLSF